MDFFERQEKAHRNTKLLVVYFVAGVILLIVTIYVAVGFVFGGINSRHHQGLWNPQLFLGVAVGTLAVISIGSIFKTAQLARGGSAVAEMLGGRLISTSTTDLDERKLINVVEEMAIASGVPVPQVYVMDREPGINAFAAGHSTSDAAVAVTRGCMKLLSRDELQGVIGHEFSHVLNGDMRLNVRLMGIIFGILCLAVIGRILLYARGSSRRDRNPLPLLGLALILVGWIGVLFGRLIQAAVSRQREFLADSSAVQFTRNPAGLSGALKKIGGLAYGSKLESAHAGEASHMFFGNGMGESLFGLLATHPPLASRIRAIEPAWDGKFPRVAGEAAPSRTTLASGTAGKAGALAGLDAESLIVFGTGREPAPRIAPPRIAPPPIPAPAVLPNVGNVTTEHLRYAVELRDSFPPAVQNAARDPLGASALIYALLTSPEPELRAKQLDLVARAISYSARQETERLLPEIAPIAAHAKLPLVDLALPALRRFSDRQYEQFSAAMQQLIDSDEEIDLFEYVLQKVVQRHLEPQFKGVRKPVVQFYSLKGLANDCSVLLSAMASVGADDPAKANEAFQRSAQRLSYQAQTPLNFVPEAQCDLEQVDAALNRLNQAVPQIKKNVLNACAETVAADGVIQEMEAELLRAVADTLDCPMPPFVQPKAEATAR
jgi:Zn-dependent protease with chaperone function